MKLGDFIRESRLNKGMSQKDFSDFLGVSYVSLNRAENNHKCGLKLLNALSENLDISIAELRQMIVEENEINEQE